MTLMEFAANLRDELVSFFKARFGRDWQVIVARQAGLHPRWYERWRQRPPMAPYRLHKLEMWARSIGFVSATDERLRAALEAEEKFKEAAAQAVQDAERKRNESSRLAKAFDGPRIAAQMAAAMKRVRESAAAAQPPDVCEEGDHDGSSNRPL